MILPRPFDPRVIAGLALWLDGADSPSQWRDRSGYSRHAVQLATNNQPSVGTLNGRSALYFDGTNDTLALPVMPLGSWHAFVAHAPANNGTVLYVATSSTQSLSLSSDGAAAVAVTSGSPTTADALYAADSRIGAGWNQGALKGFYKGAIGEIVVYETALTAAQASAVTRYLVRKWGL